MTRIGIVLAILSLLISACVQDNRPESCDADEVTVELELTAEALSPSDPAVCRGQEVTLEIASEVDGIIHIHGYDEAVPATEVAAGQDLSLTFTAERSGQFPIELHPADDPAGVSVGVFAVHES